MKNFYDIATHSMIPEFSRKMAMLLHEGLTPGQAVSDHSKIFRLTERESTACYKETLQMLDANKATS